MKRPRKPRRPSTTRNFADPQYKAWRAAVYARDGRACRKCGCRRGIQAHHIRRWADFPQLRYALGNGITLCYACHKLMWNNEASYAAWCLLTLLKGRPGNGPQKS